MFTSLFSVIKNLFNFKWGLGIKITAANFIITIPLFIVICYLQLMYVLLIVILGLIYAFFYGIIKLIKSAINKGSKDKNNISFK